MELYLQFGWGMKKLVLDFSKTWDNVNVILSPRDISPEQLIKWSKEFKKTIFLVYLIPNAIFQRVVTRPYRNMIIGITLWLLT